MSAFIFRKTIQLPPPTDDDRRAGDQRIRDTIGIEHLEIPLSVLKRVPAQIKAGAGRLSCIIAAIGKRRRLVELGTEVSYSVALDIGTTNLVALLYDNVSESAVLQMTFENPQIAFGSDILTRAHHAMTGLGEDVSAALVEGVNRTLRGLCESAGISSRDIHGLVAAGNTIMTHFFLGLDISTIPVDPFVPIARTPGFFTARDLALELNPEAVVYVFPNAGSYVGGDIVAGILAAGIYQTETLSALIDVGTNAEIVIGNKDWMLVGAGAAGPALEEGISRIGKRACTGIVYDIEITNGTVKCKTFDEETPEGICGSGMVSLLHALYKAGIIDSSGTLNPGAGNVTAVEGEPAYSISCGRGATLLIRQTELQNFMKSKAAMFTLLLVLARSVGIAFKDISAVYVSGALGTGIDAEKAVAIGMLPAWRPGVVKALGNTSLQGGRMLIADADLVETINEITSKITYKHMHDDPEFMKEYLGAVFIPHTNPELLKAT